MTELGAIDCHPALATPVQVALTLRHVAGLTGALVRMADQDRSRWDRAMIDEGRDLTTNARERDHLDARLADLRTPGGPDDLHDTP